MAYSPQSIANYILDLANSQGVDDVSPMKILKLVYFAHGWHLAMTEQPLIDEQIEAWPHGPVVPSLYRDFKHFGNAPVTERAPKRPLDPYDDWDASGICDHIASFESEADETEQKVSPATTEAILRRVFEVYKPFSAIQLSNMTHKPGDPWDHVIKEYREKYGFIPRNLDIPIELIRERFFKLYSSHQGNREQSAPA